MLYLIASFLISFLVCLLLIRLRPQKFRDFSEGEQKFHTWEAIRTGGVALYMALLVSAVAFYVGNKNFAKDTFLLLFVSLPVFMGGIWEDVTKKVNPTQRLVFAFLSGVLAGLFLNAHLTRVDVPVIDWFLSNSFLMSLLFTSFALSGVSNAINIIDGFNGLASGVGIIIFLSYAYVSFLLGDQFLLYLSLTYASALVGFLLWNFPFGLIFLGDGGAYLTGFLAGVIGVLIVSSHPEVSAWFPLTLLFYPVWETLFSMFRRKFLHGYDSTVADTKHFHSLIYKRLIKATFRSSVPPQLKNSLTSPYLWFMQILCTIPAILFWNNTPVLVLTCISFAIFYTWLYFRIVRFKTPKIMMVGKVIGRCLE